MKKKLLAVIATSLSMMSTAQAEINFPTFKFVENQSYSCSQPDQDLINQFNNETWVMSNAIYQQFAMHNSGSNYRANPYFTTYFDSNISKWYPGEYVADGNGGQIYRAGFYSDGSTDFQLHNTAKNNFSIIQSKVWNRQFQIACSELPAGDNRDARGWVQPWRYGQVIFFTPKALKDYRSSSPGYTDADMSKIIIHETAHLVSSNIGDCDNFSCSLYTHDGTNNGAGSKIIAIFNPEESTQNADSYAQAALNYYNNN